jgi:peptidoglycan/LPS O-acetylase OafA/YrhL
MAVPPDTPLGYAHPWMNTEAILSRLARRTSSGRYIPEIDGMRFVSILLVLLFHVGIIVGMSRGTSSLLHEPFGGAFAPPTGRGLVMDLVSQGWFGVDIFFLVSGFVLALPFIAAQMKTGPQVSLPRYFVRRLTRIEPPYVVALTICFVVALVAGSGVSGWHYLTGLLYMHGFVSGFPNPLNGVTWSLEVEVQFYLLVPLLALLFASRNSSTRRMVMLLIALLATAYQLALFGPRVQTFVGAWLQFFLAGWLLADIYLTEWRGAPSPDRRWDLVSLVGWPFLFAGLMASPSFERMFGPWVAMALFAAAFKGPMTRRFLTNRWLTTIGGMCYSIYLVHYVLLISLRPLIAGLRTGSAWLDMAISSALLLPIVLVISTLFFVLIERPCMDPGWTARLARRFQDPTIRIGRGLPPAHVAGSPAELVERIQVAADRVGASVKGEPRLPDPDPR